MAGGGAGLGAGNPEYLQRVMGGASSGVNKIPESRAERAAKAAPQARQQAQQTQQAPLAATTLAPEAQTQVQPQAAPRQQPTNYSYTTEANRALNLPTNQGQVFEQLQRHYAPMGTVLQSTGAPSRQQMRQLSNQIASNSSAYQNTADKFGNLYADLVEGRMSEKDYVTNLQKMQELSRKAAGQYDDVNKIFENQVFGAPRTIAGVPQQRNTLGLNPAQRFTLPKETWNMKPQELLRWIEKHEKNAGKDSFMGNAAWVVGPALIGGAAATGLTGITGPSAINSAIGSGIENLTGMTSKASGGIVNLLRSKS